MIDAAKDIPRWRFIDYDISKSVAYTSKHEAVTVGSSGVYIQTFDGEAVDAPIEVVEAAIAEYRKRYGKKS